MTSTVGRACSIGIDLGTTAIKVVAFADGAAGEQITLASRPSRLRRGADGAAELDPNEEYAALLEALTETVSEAHRLGHTIARIGVSAAMHSLLAVAADGAPLTPAMTWADLRAEANAEALWRSPQGPALYAHTGTPIHAMSPLAKLLWLRDARPDIFQRAARFVGLKEWIWYQWFDEWVIDASLASATGLYNLRQRRWDTEALALVGLDAARLSTVVPTDYRHADKLPGALRAAGVDGDCVVVIGASDGTLANLAVHATDGRRLVVTIGTSLAVRVGSKEIATDPQTRTFCYALSEQQSLYLLGAASNTGGSTLEWMYQRSAAALAPREGDVAMRDAALTFEQAMEAAGATMISGLYFLPYIAGERAPLWTTRTVGALVGLRSEHTAIHALRAAAEGVMLNARWIAEPFLSAPQPPEAAIASGGGFQSAWMRQLAADVFGLPVYAVASVEASARGAALLADLAAGARQWDEIAQPLAPASVALPAPAEHAVWTEKSAKFKQLAQLVLVSGVV